MPIVIRRGQQVDWPELVDFNCRMAKETENITLDRTTVTKGVQSLLADGKMGFYIIAESTGADSPEIAGALMVTTEWSDWRNGLFWWIQSVYVRPEFRRQGIYRRLYAHVKQLAEDAGNVSGFRLYVEKENSAAQKTYTSLGMAETHYLMYEEEIHNHSKPRS